jgi:membrane protease subunit HflK
MAWNEPGGGKKDPWGDRGGDQGPPDLDEVIKKFQDGLGKLFGGGGGGNRAGKKQGKSGFGALIVVALVMWLAYDMFYIIDQGEQGVVLRFGKYVDTLQAGPNIRMPRPIERVLRLDVEQVRNAEIGYRSEGRSGKMSDVDNESLMLTQDENIVDIKLAIQYKVKSASDYMFYVRSPEATLREVTESALREVVGKSKMDFALTEGRGEIADRVRDLLQLVLDQYQTGLILTSVNLQDAQPPEQVQHAFADAVKAREDEERLKNEAQAYSNDIIPRARGAAARQLEESNAYKSQVIAKAEGEASRFKQVLKEYQLAPEVTRKRLYLDTVENVLSNSSKIMVNVENSNNMMFIPLDRFMRGDMSSSVSGLTNSLTSQQNEQALTDRVERRLRDSLRNRGER